MYQQIGVILDKEKTGYINFSTLCTLLILLQTRLPNSKEIKEYDMKLCVVVKGDDVSREDFVKVETWFDASEKCEQRERAKVFERASMIKNLLFEVNKIRDKVYV